MDKDLPTYSAVSIEDTDISTATNPSYHDQNNNALSNDQSSKFQIVSSVLDDKHRVESTTEEEATKPDPQISPFILLGRRFAFFVVALAIAGGLMVGGIFKIKRGKELTQESCQLIDFRLERCSYQCNCRDVDQNGNEVHNTDDHSSTTRVCDTCEGTQYTFFAEAQAKCEDQSLRMIEKTCPMDNDIGGIGTEFNCYVLDCEDQKFTLRSPTHYIVWGTVMVVAACLIAIVDLVVLASRC